MGSGTTKSFIFPSLRTSLMSPRDFGTMSRAMQASTSVGALKQMSNISAFHFHSLTPSWVRKTGVIKYFLPHALVLWPR